MLFCDRSNQQLKEYFKQVITPFAVINQHQDGTQEGNVEHMLTYGESVNKFKKDIVDFLFNRVKEEVYCHKQSSWKLQNTFNNTCMKTIRVAPEKHQFILIVGN